MNRKATKTKPDVLLAIADAVEAEAREKWERQDFKSDGIGTLHAHHAVCKAMDLRATIKAGDMVGAAVLAFQMGVAAAKMHSARDWSAVQRITRGSTAGVKGASARAEVWRSVARSTAKELWAKHPKRSIRQVAVDVGKMLIRRGDEEADAAGQRGADRRQQEKVRTQFIRSDRTVRKAIRDLKPTS